MWSFQSESTAVVTITVFEFGCYALSAPYIGICSTLLLQHYGYDIRLQYKLNAHPDNL